MALIICPECGRQISDRAAACPQCGYPISAAPASQANDRGKDLMLARRAIEERNYEEAGRYYTKAYENDPFDWEASFYKSYCQAINNMDLPILTNCIPNVRKLIEGIPDEEKKISAYREMFSRCAVLSGMALEMFNASDRYSYIKEPTKDFGDALVTNLPAYLPEDVKELAAKPINDYATMLINGAQRLLDSMRSGLF